MTKLARQNFLLCDYFKALFYTRIYRYRFCLHYVAKVKNGVLRKMHRVTISGTLGALSFLF